MNEGKGLEPTAYGGTLVHIHTDADRKVKVIRADGTEGEAMWSDALRGLLVKANVPYADALGEVVRSVRDEEINARRAAGLNDLCEMPGCRVELSASTAKKRNRTPHPWHCHSCAQRHRAGYVTAEDVFVCHVCSAPLGESPKAKQKARRRPPSERVCFRCHSAARRKRPPRSDNRNYVCVRCHCVSKHLGTGKAPRFCDGCITYAQSAPCRTCSESVPITRGGARQRLMRPEPWQCQDCMRVDPSVARARSSHMRDQRGELTPERLAILARANAASAERMRGKHRAACRRGHAMSPTNTYVSPRGVRACRQCMRINDIASKARRRGR